MNVRARLVGCRELFLTVFQRLEDLSQLCCARLGFVGAFIEDKNSGAILIQQPIRRQMQTRTIDSKLTAMGKNERAISVSGYVYRGNVKYTDDAFNKTTIYKQKSQKHADAFTHAMDTACQVARVGVCRLNFLMKAGLVCCIRRSPLPAIGSARSR